MQSDDTPPASPAADFNQQALDLINAWEAGEYLHPAQKKAALQVAIRDALAQAHAEGLGWQPIETAPRDGICVIVAAKGCAGTQFVCEAWFDDDTEQWWQANTHPTDFHDGRVEFPTYWMPLPPPPRALAEGGGR